MEIPSTLKPAEVAVALVESGIVKHKTRTDVLFIKAVSFPRSSPQPYIDGDCMRQVLAGVMLSFGGLLSQIAGGGSAGLTASNPGIAKLLSGFVFPVGLVMCVQNASAQIPNV
jgi:hypothetical protein